MKNNLKTRYIGNTEKWTIFWNEVIQSQQLCNFFGLDDGLLLNTEISKILADVDKNTEFYQHKIEAYPFKLQQSFRDMWLSGTVDIFEVIFRFFQGYREPFERCNDLHYFKMFLNPQYIYTFQQLSQNIELLDGLGLDEFFLENMIERQEYDINPQEMANFYHYPPDEYTLPIAMNTQSMHAMYLVLDGEIDVDGGALFIFADESFADGEYEVGELSYSESTWIRYPTMPESFLFTLSYLLFKKDVTCLDDLLKNRIFELLYK